MFGLQRGALIYATLTSQAEVYICITRLAGLSLSGQCR